MALSPRAADFQGFFFVFLFSFVQNALLLSKGCEERKSFSNFLIFGGSKHRSFFAYAWGEVFMNIETSFVQNGLELSKGNEGKSFSEFPVFGGSIRLDSSLTGGGRHKTFPWKGGHGCRGQG